MTRLISEKTVFDGWRKLKTVEVLPKSMQHEGYMKAALSREVYLVGTSVSCVLFNPDTDQVLLNRQFRTGAYLAEDNNPYILENCAGMVDKGENPEEAAIRETKEETGCDVTDIEFIVKSYPAPSVSNEASFIYCCCIRNAKEGFYGIEEEGEEIKTTLFSITEIKDKLNKGEIHDAKTILGLQWLLLNHARLKQKWGKK